MKRRFHPGGVVRLETGQPVIIAPPDVSASMNPEAIVPAWRHPLFQDRELIEVSTFGRRGEQYVEGPCRHPRAVPVESVLGELVAWLCPGCDEQLPAEWRSA